jgi:NADPH-dependent FMN reductase
MLKIAIIIGSTRPGRNGEAVAKWVYQIAQRRSDAEFELVDIKDFNLPLLDEPVPPSIGQYSKAHTNNQRVVFFGWEGGSRWNQIRFLEDIPTSLESRYPRAR